MSKTRVEQRFAALAQRGEKGFVAYIGAGDPTLEGTRDIVLRLEDAGVDLVELGLPFSDPLADGRTNQDAASRALAAGATFGGVMECIASIRRDSQIPLVIYAYLNTLCAQGVERSMQAAADAGVDGFLILDLPCEEAAPYRKPLVSAGLNNIVLITPTTPDVRMAKILRHANGFVYCVSREGVTGVRDTIDSGARGLVDRIRRQTDLPIALGFGIGTPQQAAEAASFSDAVVVGSAIVNAFHQQPHDAGGRSVAARFVADLVRAVKS